MGKEFDWRDDAVVVVPTQVAIAVYETDKGEIAIRQDGGMEDDDIVYVSKAALPALIDRLRKFTGN